MVEPLSAPPPRESVVLVVDDEPDIVGALRAVLTRRLKGVRVVTATSPREGLELLDREPVDLVMSDYKMPGMTGMEFLASARARAPSVVRVMMTAFPQDSLAIQAINELKLDHFFTKPFSLEAAAEVVGQLLDAKRRQESQQAAFARSLEAVRRATVPP